jgi:hypothetical protein
MAKDTDYLEWMNMFSPLGISAKLDIPELCPICGLDIMRTGYILSLSDQMGHAHTIKLTCPDQISMLLSFFYGFSWCDDSFSFVRYPLHFAIPDLCSMFKIRPESLGITSENLANDFQRPWSEYYFRQFALNDER